MPWESFKLFSENLNGLDCLCSSSKLNPRGSHQGKSTEFYQLPLSSPYVPKEKRETWTGMREMGPNFSLQHPDSTSEAANKVTRDNSLGDSFWTIFSSGHCDTRKGIQSCKILLFGHFQGWAILNHGWPGIALVTVLLLVRGWAREPPETLLTTSTSVIHLSCSKK